MALLVERRESEVAGILRIVSVGIGAESLLHHEGNVVAVMIVKQDRGEVSSMERDK